jgi:hypothetical protein
MWKRLDLPTVIFEDATILQKRHEGKRKKEKGKAKRAKEAYRPIEISREARYRPVLNGVLLLLSYHTRKEPGTQPPGSEGWNSIFGTDFRSSASKCQQ